MTQRPCPCGSNQPRHDLHDARGIFVTFCCDDCEAEKRARFRPEVFSDSQYDSDEPIEGD
jgi:hypothetical protein